MPKSTGVVHVSSQSIKPFPDDEEDLFDNFGTVRMNSLMPGRYIMECLDAEIKTAQRRDGSGSFQSRQWIFRPIGGSVKRPKTLPLDWRWRHMSSAEISPTNQTGKIIAALMGVDMLTESVQISRKGLIGKYLVVELMLDERGQFNQPNGRDAFDVLTPEFAKQFRWRKEDLEEGEETASF